MKANKRGFTLIELIITVTILIVVVAIVGVAVGGCVGCGGDKAKATDSAKAWAEAMGITPKGVSCVDHDTDGDGYVSCTVSEASKDGGTKMHSLECAHSWSWNSGCRKPKLGAPGFE